MGKIESQSLLDRISSIREERDTQKRLEMLIELNDSLPEIYRLRMPSLITNAYVRRALDLIEERVSLLAMGGNTLTTTRTA
jgi:DNA replication initiation complex subunit (GINS family)